ncbi:hypothetical protein ABEI05_08825 [Erwinia billingiae]|uniref:hypothetical protein n=1 Tax=Erwinia billingiae TaxID=182337 RepID=UPI0032091C5A
MAAATERYYLCAPQFFATVARQILTDLDEDGQALLHQVTDFYHPNLLDNEGAQGWLASSAQSGGAGGGWSDSYDPQSCGRVLKLYGRHTMAEHMVME